MARPGRTESASLPIWLKLSEADAAQLEQVLARPEFAGWTRAEWCLEIIQTTLRYYARRPAAEPTHERAAARPAAPPEPARPEPARPEPSSAAPPEPSSAASKPRRAAPKPRRPAARARPAASRNERPVPEAPAPQQAAPERVMPERAVPERAVPEPGAGRPEPEAGPPEPLDPPECSHPAEARDYQSGTCAACGAILWD